MLVLTYTERGRIVDVVAKDRLNISDKVRVIRNLYNYILKLTDFLQAEIDDSLSIFK